MLRKVCSFAHGYAKFSSDMPRNFVTNCDKNATCFLFVSGLLGFYELLAFLYFVIGCMCAPSLWETLQKQGPMHDVLSMLTKVLCLQASAALCMCIHLYRFARDGEGSSLAENLSEGKIE